MLRRTVSRPPRRARVVGTLCGMARPIHFVLDRADSYQGVQAQLLDLIDPHLPDPKPERGDYRPGALNFCLFIRPQG